MIRKAAAASALFFSLGLLSAPAWAQDSDRIPDEEILTWVQNACQSKEFSTFFEHFVQNPAVRAAYTAPQVEIRKLSDPKQVVSTAPAADYKTLPLSFWDYSYADTASADKFEAGQSETIEFLQLDFQDLPGDGRKVSFVKAEYLDAQGQSVGNPEGIEYERVRTYGDPRAFVFAWRDGCWRLTQDLR